ncbi:MAG TPA: hypothetical protein VGO80_17425 [Solirubrobacteraceae bacterium]|nr:hypothetical protein [Solirubrobacteraceae bacterium]
MIVAVILGVLYRMVGPVVLRVFMVSLGVLIIGVAITGIAYLTTISLSAKSRPRMVAKLERTDLGERVTGTVTAAGLKSKEHIAVRVIGISTRERLSELHVGHARAGEVSTDRQVVYSSRTGPDSAGATTVDFAVPIGGGLYERLDVEAELVSEDEQNAAIPEKGKTESNRCDRSTRQFSCMSIVVPPASRRPQLAAQWKLPVGAPPVLKLSAHMIGVSSEDRLLSAQVARGLPSSRVLPLAGKRPLGVGAAGATR